MLKFDDINPMAMDMMFLISKQMGIFYDMPELSKEEKYDMLEKLVIEYNKKYNIENAFNKRRNP